MSEADKIVSLRISLREIAPEIWRRVEVPLSLHLKALHDVIQAVFCWQDYHLFEFRVGDRLYGIPDPPDDHGRRVRQARGIRLAALLAQGIDRFDYTYDFGDGWNHEIVVEAVREAAAGLRYPRFVAGARRGPPEDCGGALGYEDFVVAATDPGHAEHQEVIAWYGGPYDPEEIDRDQIDDRLGDIVSRREAGKAGYERSRLLRPEGGWRAADAPVSGTEGYDLEAAVLFHQYEGLSFAEVHANVLHLVPAPPCRVLDIGAGSGRDAAGFAALGHSVVAVEPTDALRLRAVARHRSPRITWVNDSLPALRRLQGMAPFDLVMLTAVWMHLDAAQRAAAMQTVAALVRPGGVMMLSLRYGPVPPGRRMFAVPAGETEALATAHGLRRVLKLEGLPARLGQTGVTWTRLAFVADGDPVIARPRLGPKQSRSDGRSVRATN